MSDKDTMKRARELQHELIAVLEGEDLEAALIGAMAVVAAVGIQMDDMVNWEQVHSELDRMVERARTIFSRSDDPLGAWAAVTEAAEA